MRCINQKCITCERYHSQASKYRSVSATRCAHFLKIASVGVPNTTLKNLVIKEPLDQEFFQLLTKQNFPALEHVDISWVKVNELSVNENIKSVILRSCNYERVEPFSSNDFPFPMAKSLALVSMITHFSPVCRLPKLEALEHLELRNSIVNDKLSSNKFPALRSLVLEGNSVFRTVKITRLNKLHRAELHDTENLPQKTNWKKVNMVSLKNVRSIDVGKLADGEVFPNLAALYLDCIDNVNVKDLQPSSHIRKLSIKCGGTILNLSNLEIRYRRLMDLSLDGKMDLADIPQISSLKRVKIIPTPSKNVVRKWLKNCINLQSFNQKEVKFYNRWVS